MLSYKVLYSLIWQNWKLKPICFHSIIYNVFHTSLQPTICEMLLIDTQSNLWIMEFLFHGNFKCEGLTIHMRRNLKFEIEFVASVIYNFYHTSLQPTAWEVIYKGDTQSNLWIMKFLCHSNFKYEILTTHMRRNLKVEID